MTSKDWLWLVILLTLLTACGQKGGLYLPGHPARQTDGQASGLLP